MNNWKINKTVDLTRGIDGVEVWPHALLVTGDKNAHEWNVTVMDNGKAASLDGIIQAYFVRSDGATVTATGSVAGNVATVTLPENCYAYEGDLSAVMQLIQDDASVTLSALLLRVRQITTDVIIDPGTEIPSLDDLLAQIESMKQATKDANAATTNANQAATDAENRVNEAISTAEGRVNTAVQSAETATSKANASATKADAATTGANTAAGRANAAAKAAEEIVVEKNIATKDYVEEQIDAIEIGGRNLLTRKDCISNIYCHDGVDGFEIIIPKSSSLVTFQSENIWPSGKYKLGNIYTLSFLAKASGDTKLHTDFYPDSFNQDGGFSGKFDQTIFDVGTDEHLYTLTDVLQFTGDGQPTTMQLRFWRLGTVNNEEITIRNIKIERGNKATDWSPAPEDVDAKINAIEIGGTNLLLDTNVGSLEAVAGPAPRYFSNKNITTASAGFIQLSDPPTNNIKWGVDYKLISNERDSIGKMLAWYDNSVVVPMLDGETYTMSCWARAVSGAPILRFQYGTGTYHYYDITIKENTWKRYSYTFKLDLSQYGSDGGTRIYMGAMYFKSRNSIGDELQCCGTKLELGDKPTDWSPAPEDVECAISRRAAVTYDYGGRNLKEVFGTAEALHAAIAAEDYTNIAVGDYWPITLNGKFWDYGSYTVKSGVKYYSDNGLQTQAGTTAATYEGAYVSDTVVSFSLSGTTYYVATADCLDHFERTCNNVTVKLEVAAINHYWRYGDTGGLTGNKPHIVFVSRDCLPFLMRMRKGNTHWESTAINNPWIGSAMFKTLNDETHGVLPLVAATDVGAYIYAGPNNLGMRARMETKAPDAANATGWRLYDRGKLFLPSVAEVWGHPFWAEMNWEGGLGNQFAIFRDSRRHISKGCGDNAGRVGWSLGSSNADSTTSFAFVCYDCIANGDPAAHAYAVPVCFIFA